MSKTVTKAYTIPDSFSGYQKQSAGLIALIGLFWSASVGLGIHFLRAPLPAHEFAIVQIDILRSVCLAWALVLVASVPFVLYSFSLRTALKSLAGFWLLIGLVMFAAPRLGVGFDVLLVLLVVFGLALMLRHVRFGVGHSAIAILMAVVLGIVHVTKSFSAGPSNPYALELALMGKQHADTLFHAAIANSLFQTGAPSAGLDGFAPISYHILSHRFVAGMVGWLGVAPINGYALFLMPVGGPVLVSLFLLSGNAAARSERGGLTPALALAGVIGWLLLMSDWVAPGFWIAESYLFSLWPFTGALMLMGTARRGTAQDAFPMYLMLAAMVGLAALAKISTGIVLSCGVAVFLAAHLGWTLRALLLGGLFGVLPFAAVYLLWPVNAGHADESILRPLETLRTWPGLTIPLLVLVPVIGAISFPALRNAPHLRPVILAIWAIVLSGALLVLALYLEGATALNFATPAIWAGLFLVPFLGLAPPWIAGRRPAWQYFAILLGVVWVYHENGHIKTGTKKYQAYQTDIRKGMRDAEGDAGLAALRFGPMILAARQADGVFVPLEARAFWADLRNCWVGAMTPQAVAGKPMLMGLPSPEAGCDKNRFYGFGQLDPEVSMQRNLSDAQICEAGAARGFSRIAIVEQDLSARVLDCR